MPIVVTLAEDAAYRKEISPEAATLCAFFRLMLQDEPEGEVMVVGISPEIMDRVLVFLEHHATVRPMRTIVKPITTNVLEDIVDQWDADFIALDEDQETLVDLINAGNYLDCPSLVELGILKIACMIKDKEPDEVKRIFHIGNDITPEEERMVRENNMWVFELGQNKNNNNDSGGGGEGEAQ
jgi:hypothetical protein